jgi:hypothetical protein
VSDYRLDDRVRSPADTKDFSSSFCVQTGSGALPASCTMGNGSPFPGGKARPGRDADHSPLSSAEVKNEYELYLLSPLAPLWQVQGPLLPHIYSLFDLALIKKSIANFISSFLKVSLIHITLWGGGGDNVCSVSSSIHCNKTRRSVATETRAVCQV